MVPLKVRLGLQPIALSNPTLVLSQFTDTRTYIKTSTKLAAINPSEILLPNNGLKTGVSKSFYNEDDLSGSTVSKLNEVVGEEFPCANVVYVHRKYFKDSGGLQAIRNLCVPEYLSVELELRHKYYALAAAFALLKYMEFIHNVVYAPKVTLPYLLNRCL